MSMLSIIFRTSPGSKGFVSKFTNGWWVSGIVSAQSGNPFSIYTSGFPSRDGQDQTYGIITDSPDLVPGRNNANMTHGVTAGCGDVQGGHAAPYQDPVVRSLRVFHPAGGISSGPRRETFSGVPVTTISTPRWSKTRPANFLGEGGQVEFRAEFFNIPNHAELQYPKHPGYVRLLSRQLDGGLTGCSAASAGPDWLGGPHYLYQRDLAADPVRVEAAVLDLAGSCLGLKQIDR